MRLPQLALAAEQINSNSESYVVLATDAGLLLRTGLVWSDGDQPDSGTGAIIGQALRQAQHAVLTNPELSVAIEIDAGRHPLDEYDGLTGNWQRRNTEATLTMMKQHAALMTVAAQHALISAPGCAAAVRFDWDRRHLDIWTSFHLPSGATLSDEDQALFERQVKDVSGQVLATLRQQEEVFHVQGIARAN